jgi:hypothetical protein
LDNEMQQGKGHSKRKWSERSRVGLYLGPSPQHARSVHLVLNLETGFVSPQYHHVSFDDHFKTTWKGAASLLPRPKWQERAHFVKTEIESERQPISPKVSESREILIQQEKSSKTPEAVTEIFSESPQPLMMQTTKNSTTGLALLPATDQTAISPEMARPPVPRTTATVLTDGIVTRSGRVS